MWWYLQSPKNLSQLHGPVPRAINKGLYFSVCSPLQGLLKCPHDNFPQSQQAIQESRLGGSLKAFYHLAS
jgi:hypothetical protein